MKGITHRNRETETRRQAKKFFSFLFIYFVVALIFLLIVSSNVFAQDATQPAPTPAINAETSDVINAFFTASKDAPLIGEPFEMTLTVETPAGVDLVKFPKFPEDTGPFEILNQGEVEVTTAPSGAKSYTQKMTMVLWETGLHLTPEIAATFNQGGAVSNNLVKSASFIVPSVLDPSLPPSLMPSIPPLDMQYIPPWIVVPVILVISIFIYLLRVVILPRRRAENGVKGTPAQIAIAELEDLKTQQLEAALIYPMVADKMRGYLQVRFSIGAVEMTTAELMDTLRATSLPDTLRKSLRQVLEQADLVKFARFEPDAGATVRLVNFAIKWLKEADSVEAAAA